MAELLRRGYDVYMTLVDDQQIDCVVRLEKDGKLRYLDVQIKARSLEAKHAATFAALTVRQPRKKTLVYLFQRESKYLLDNAVVGFGKACLLEQGRENQEW